MQQVFISAIYHTEPKVLKRQLRPLSLWHVFALMGVESPYICKGTKGLWDLSLAVAICAGTWESDQKWFQSKTLFADFKRWGKSCRGLDYATEHQKFLEYFDHYTQFPERHTSKDMKPARHPWPLLIVTQITPKVGESRAWNMPLPLAVSYWSSQCEIDGDDTLKSENDKAMLEEQKAYAAQLKANLEKLGKVVVKAGA